MVRSSRKNIKMDPKVTEFLYLNGFVILLLVLYMAFWRPKRQPTQLKFRRYGDKSDLSAGRRSFDERHGNEGLPDNNERHRTGERPDSSKTNERQLNVIFQYNGHDFDAYEVLGIPAGSSRANAESAYEKTIRGADADSLPFFHHAIEAIRKS
jgi:hypothetical protein